MPENIKKKYTDSERYKRGIDRILKSDQYTDEYKRILMEKLGNDYNVPKYTDTEDIDFDLLKNGGPVVTISNDSGSLVNINDKPAAVSGYLEKPIYLEDELKKAVDVEVDELISKPPKQKPLTVPKPTHDALRDQYDQAIQDLEDLRVQLNTKISELESAFADINLLNQTVDSEKLLRAFAENETQSSTERYTSVLKDFQNALQKGIQEAIERVSLTAQVRGLQAQKEVLQQQLDNLKAITENLQAQVEAQQSTIENQQEEAAASFLLTGKPGLFAKTNNTGWKIPDSNVGSKDTGKHPLHYDRHKQSWINGNTIDFYNLSEESIIFTFTYVKDRREKIKGDNLNSPFISGPNSITIGPRDGSNPGKTSVVFKRISSYKEKTFNFLTNPTAFADDIIKAVASNGDRYDIGVYYKVSK